MTLQTTKSMAYGNYTTTMPKGRVVRVTVLDMTVYRQFHAGTGDTEELARAHQRAQDQMRQEIMWAISRGWTLAELNGNRKYRYTCTCCGEYIPHQGKCHGQTCPLEGEY